MSHGPPPATDPSQPLRIHRQELFARHVAAGKTQREAVQLAGYKLHSLTICDVAGSQLYRSIRVKRRIAYLRDQAFLDQVMSVAERKQRLSEIARERIEGKHGVVREPNISAVRELNRMERVGAEPEAHRVTIIREVLLPPGSNHQIVDGRLVQSPICLPSEPDSRQSGPDNQPQP